jgi:hypothetical protein
LEVAAEQKGGLGAEVSFWVLKSKLAADESKMNTQRLRVKLKVTDENDVVDDTVRIRDQRAKPK